MTATRPLSRFIWTLAAAASVGLFLATPATAQNAPSPGTWYQLTSVSHLGAECLEGNGRGGQFGGNSVMTPCRGQSGQLWQVQSVGNGYYRLQTRDRGDGECLESNARGTQGMGGSAYMDDCQNVTGQMWRFEPTADGFFRLKTEYRGDNECLEANGRGSDYMGGTAFMDDCREVTGQKWRFDAQGSVDGRSAQTMVIDGTEVQTGAIQVTLQWDSSADLDLYVTDPAGETVSYQNKNVASGGVLDVDARAGCQSTDATVENIIWSSNPPPGTYGIRINYYRACNEGPVPYTLTLRRAGQVIETWEGMAEYEGDTYHSYTAR